MPTMLDSSNLPFMPYRVLTRAFAKTNFLIEGPIYGVNWTVTIKVYIGLLLKKDLKNITWIAIVIISR